MVDYWMRWVNFTALRGLLALIIESPGKLTPSSLDRAAIDAGVMCLASGRPRAPTSRYHHRRTLEKLGMVVKRGGRYAPNLDEDEYAYLMSCGGQESLTMEQCKMFGNRVIRSEGCRNVLWKTFAPSERANSLEEFIRVGGPVAIQLVQRPISGSRSESGIKVYAYKSTDTQRSHWGYKAVQAIHFGMRAWGVSQLFFLDQLFMVGEGYILIPVDAYQKLDRRYVSHAIFESLEFNSDWATVRVSDTLIAVADRLKFPLPEIRATLLDWIAFFPGHVVPITVSHRMIFSGQRAQLHSLIREGYLTLDSGEYVSHIRVHKDVSKLIGALPEVGQSKV